MTNDIDEIYRLMTNNLSPAQVDSLMRYVYLTRDWDIERFYSYCALGKYMNQTYKPNPWMLYRALKWRAWHAFPQDHLKHFVAFSDGIFEVELTEVVHDSTNSMGDRSIKDQQIVCMKAKVLDIIQGNGMTEVFTPPEGGELYLGIAFSYAENWRTRVPVDRHPRIILPLNPDDSTTYRMGREPATFHDIHSPQAGDRYLVFLEINSEGHVDGIGVPYNVWPTLFYVEEGGLFKIANGNIPDSGNFFGFGSSPSLNSIKTKISDVIQHDILLR